MMASPDNRPQRAPRPRPRPQGVYLFEDLQELCKPGERPTLATVEAWARDQGIRYRYDRKGGIWTTREALNASLGLGEAPANDSDPYDPNEVR